MASQRRKLIQKVGLIERTPSVCEEGAKPLSGSIRIFQQGHPQSQQGHPILCLQPRMPEECGHVPTDSEWLPRKLFVRGAVQADYKGAQRTQACFRSPLYLLEHLLLCWCTRNSQWTGWLKRQPSSCFRKWLKTPWILNILAEPEGLQSCEDVCLSPRVIPGTLN